MTNLAIIYYSSYGTTHTMAERIASTGEKEGAEVRLRHVAETAPAEVIKGQDEWQAHRDALADQPVAEPDDLAWADVAVFGSPTRYGHVTSQLQAYLDTLGPLWQEGKLADKVYTAFTSTQTAHGGQETTIQALHTTFVHFGGIIVPPGYTDPIKFKDGNPYGVSKVTGESTDLDEVDLEALDHLVMRALEVARKLAA
ncbi:MAG TPA: NAD(P)H:quinone oxidoreductase [Nocardioides sp.]|nr:NAD(P)H:quinone oxidoreductase [Nocardioides sp.]